MYTNIGEIEDVVLLEDGTILIKGEIGTPIGLEADEEAIDALAEAVEHRNT